MEDYRPKTARQSASVLSHMEKLNRLRSHFPEFDDETLKDMLAQVDGDVDQILGSFQSVSSSYEEEACIDVEPIAPSRGLQLFQQITASAHTAQVGGTSNGFEVDWNASNRLTADDLMHTGFDSNRQTQAPEASSKKQRPYSQNSGLLNLLPEPNAWGQNSGADASAPVGLGYHQLNGNKDYGDEIAGAAAISDEADVDSNSSTESDWFEMPMDPGFVNKLFEEYSNPFGSIDAFRLLPSDLNVRIPRTLAFELFRHLCLNLLKVPENSNGTDDRSKQVIEGETDGSTWEGFNSNGVDLTKETPDLREIMELEMLLHGEEAQKVQQIRAKTQKCLATKLTMQHLQATFPSLPLDMVQAKFSECGMKYEATVQRLQEEYPEKYVSKGQNTIPQDSSAYTETVNQELEILKKNTTFSNHAEAECSDPNQLRTKALEHFCLMREYARKRDESSHAKGIASYYGEMSRLHQSRMKYYNKKASEVIFSKNNGADKPSNQIDLHHLTVQEAMNRLEPFLRRKEQQLARSAQQYLAVRIVFGLGKHSDIHGPRLGPAVISYLQRKSLDYEEFYGYVIVTLRSRNRYRN